MRRCTYCGKEYDDTATACVIDRQPLTEVLNSSKDATHSVEFLRLLFKSPDQEEFAVRCAQLLAKIAGDRITLLRPDTKWSEIIEWAGPTSSHATGLALALKKEVGVDPKDILTYPEFTTFRDLVEYVCASEDKSRNGATEPRNKSHQHTL